MQPLGLVTSKLDRVIWNSMSFSSTSNLNKGNTISPFNSMIVSFWDSLIADYKCTDYTIVLPSIDFSGNDVNSFMQVKMPTATMPQARTRSVVASTIVVFDIN